LPVESKDGQYLYVIERTDKGMVERRMDPVIFVPLLSGIA